MSHFKVAYLLIHSLTRLNLDTAATLEYFWADLLEERLRKDWVKRLAGDDIGGGDDDGDTLELLQL